MCCFLIDFFSSFVTKKLLFGVCHLGFPSGEKTTPPAALPVSLGCQVSSSHGCSGDKALCLSGSASSISSVLLMQLSHVLCQAALLGPGFFCCFVAAFSASLQTRRCALLLTTLLPAVKTRLRRKLMAPANYVHLHTVRLHLQVQSGIWGSQACALMHVRIVSTPVAASRSADVLAVDIRHTMQTPGVVVPAEKAALALTLPSSGFGNSSLCFPSC